MVGFVSAAKAGTLASEVANNADANSFFNIGISSFGFRPFEKAPTSRLVIVHSV